MTGNANGADIKAQYKRLIQVPQYVYKVAGDTSTHLVILFEVCPDPASPWLPRKGARLRDMLNKKDTRLTNGEDTFKLSETSAKITYRLQVSPVSRLREHRDSPSIRVVDRGITGGLQE